MKQAASLVAGLFVALSGRGELFFDGTPQYPEPQVTVNLTNVYTTITQIFYTAQSPITGAVNGAGYVYSNGVFQGDGSGLTNLPVSKAVMGYARLTGFESTTQIVGGTYYTIATPASALTNSATTGWVFATNGVTLPPSTYKVGGALTFNRDKGFPSAAGVWLAVDGTNIVRLAYQTPPRVSTGEALIAIPEYIHRMSTTGRVSWRVSDNAGVTWAGYGTFMTILDLGN